jgi:hypothetical protein
VRRGGGIGEPLRFLRLADRLIAGAEAKGFFHR